MSATIEARQVKLSRARDRLAKLQTKLQRYRAGVESLRAQIEVLAQETKPPIEWHAASTSDLETDRGVPSFALSARMHRRHNTTGVNVAEGLHEPILQLYTKMAAQVFAKLHGVQVPAMLGRWPDPDAVDWKSLPDRFVLKSNRGGGGMSVFPLERNGKEFIDRLTNEPTTREEVTEKLWTKHRESSRYFAEEFLVGRTGEPGRTPYDIKVFCFYGEPGYIEVRTGDWSRAKNAVSRARTFLPDGTELFNVRALIPWGADLPRPEDFESILAASATLSHAIRRPIERLDFYETDHGLVFGEVTQNPGHAPALVPEWDRRFGEKYEEAYARLLSDLVAEGALHLEYGNSGEGDVSPA